MEVDSEENEEANSRDSSKTDMAGEESPPSQSDSGKPKGVLVLHAHQKKRPKKVLQWRPEEELEMHHYFELDETERGMFLVLEECVFPYFSSYTSLLISFFSLPSYLFL